MLVEDTSAFIEQLEVREEDRRAERHRRRVARAELELLRVEWEARIEAEALHSLENELARRGEEQTADAGRRLLRGRRQSSLEREVDASRARLRAKRELAQARRERLRRLASETPGSGDISRNGTRFFRLHSAQHHLECSERRFARLATSQAELPVLVVRKDGRSWWWYRDRFWWDDEGMAPRDVATLVLQTDLGRTQQAQALAEARATVLGEVSTPPGGEAVSQVVRFAVWCRDRGRCVDCGTVENVGFDEIAPWSKAGRVAANVELRCMACRERRADNAVRARVSRARIEAMPYRR